MAIGVPVGETDDPYFIALLNSIVQKLADRTMPDEVWVVKIDNWFDHKWLPFSGISVLSISTGAA